MEKEKTYTHWRQGCDMNYLGSWDIVPGADLILTIASVGMETVKNPVQKTEEVKRVIHFAEKGYKPMVVNTTNAKAISSAVGSPYIEDWPNHPIAIYSLHGKWFGEERDALRIRTKAPSVKTFICQNCGKAIVPAGGKNAEELVEISKRNCDGKELCVECMKKFKSEKEQNL